MPCGSQVGRHSPSQGVDAGQGELKDSMFLLTSRPPLPGQGCAWPPLLDARFGSSWGPLLVFQMRTVIISSFTTVEGTQTSLATLGSQPLGPSEDTGACLHQGARLPKVRVHQSPQLQKKTQWGFNRIGPQATQTQLQTSGSEYPYP